MVRQSYIAMFVLLFSLFTGFAQAQEEPAAAPVNINQADAASLSDLDGIGQTKAEAIVTYRETNGPFKAVGDLVNVTGIGEKTLANNQDRLSIE